MSNFNQTLENSHPLRYVLRDDSFFCTRRKCSAEIRKIAQYIEEATGIQCAIIDAQQQIIWAQREVAELKRHAIVVSLDKWCVGDYNLQISRNFGENDELLGFIHDPIPLEVSQRHEVLFVDDDISSGRTLKYVSSLFRNCKFPSFFALSKFIDDDIFDIVDARDFIPRAKYGGLMFNGNRISYLDPRVDLTKRMKFKNQDVASIFREKVLALWK